MGVEVFLVAVCAAHVPGLDKQEGYVCQIWEDGEVTLQKSGDLMHKRNLHMIGMGHPTLAAPIEQMPVQMYGHGCAFVQTVEQAHELAKLLFAD